MYLAAFCPIDHLAWQSSPSSQHVRHRGTQECLWVDARHSHNPCWLQEELKGRGLPPLLKLHEEEEQQQQQQGEGEGAEEEEAAGSGNEAGKEEEDEAEEPDNYDEGSPVASYGTKPKEGKEGKEEEDEAEEPDNYDDDEGLPVASYGTKPKLQEGVGALVHLYREKNQHDHVTRAHSKSQDDDLRALVASLKACTQHRDLHRGSRIHEDIKCRALLPKNVFLGSALVNMYAKCSALSKAQDVFDEIPSRDAVLWNALMAGYAEHGDVQKVQACFERMQCEGLSPDAVTLMCVLKACASAGAIDKGQELHARIFREGTLKGDRIVGTTLVDMYAKCGLLAKAHEVFDEIPARNVVSWNALITGYVLHGHGEEALSCFERMHVEGLSPTNVTFLSILKACGSTRAACMGQKVHSKIIKEGLLDNNTILSTALIDMYAKCGLLENAQGVFKKLPVCDVVAWNALIAGYAQQEHGEKALNCFEQMKSEGFLPDDTTFSSSLKACGSKGLAEQGQEIHAEIVKNGSWEESFVVGNALVDMYAKCSMLEEAQKVFDNHPVRNVVTWNTLITGYVQEGHSEQAVALFKQMQVDGPLPDSVTFIGALKGCGGVGAVHMGQEIHAEIVEDGYLESDMIVGTALVDMYASCGMPADAQEVFNDLQAVNVVSWNALLEGYSQIGMNEIVFDAYNKMIGGGVVPDLATYGVILNACSHTGLFDKSIMYLEAMCIDHSLFPTSEQFSCLVDLFSRAGRLDEAVILIKEMPFCANLAVWHTLLSACGKCGNMVIGRLAFEYAEKLDEADSAAYICLSNI